jgi:hypothetical protein
MKSLVFAFILLMCISFASSALFISNTVQDTIYPGDSGELTISLKNDFDYDIEDVSLSLDFSKTKFTAIGSSEKSMDEIKDGDKEDFKFTIKSASDLSPGDYLIPYTMGYKYDNTTPSLTGFIGATVNSKTKLDYSVSADNLVIGQKSRVNLKIINKGFGDIKFATITLQPSGFKLLSSDKSYMGLIGSDDFETANFDIIFEKSSARVMATMTYMDFENNEKIENIDLPIKVYSVKDAESLGIIQKSNFIYFIFTPLLIIIFILVIRRLRKKKKQKEKDML